MTDLPPIWSEPLALGFSVFPCTYPSKRPAVEKWEPFRTRRATDDELAAWATCGYNVAIVCGPLSGIWVLDTDSALAEAALMQLAGNEGLPATLTVNTPRGHHRYWKHPGTYIGNRARISGVTGIDARGDTGYVLSPGSDYVPTDAERAAGKLEGRYSWTGTLARDQIADAPQWLINLVTRSNQPETYGEPAPCAPSDQTSEYGRRALVSEIAKLRTAVPGGRNEQLNMSAFALAQLVAGGEISTDEYVSEIRAAATAIGLEPDEIEPTLASGWKSGWKQPRKGKTLDPESAFTPIKPTLGPLERGATIFADRMDEIFAGCVFVRSIGRIWTPSGIFRDKLAFDTEFGGFTFTLGGERNKPTDSAWDAFRLNKQWVTPQVEDVCFRPELASGLVIAEEGRTLVNTFVPIKTKRIAGDPTRFLDFLQRLLPIETDRAIILAYMASLVQNPGRKFQWWPVIQGTEGNGKSLLLRCLTHAVGMRYTHLPNTHDLARNGMKFNGWISGNLLCGVEEISLGDKRNFLEEFKPVVTNDRIPIERKGVDQVTGDNRINGMLFTNHRDGVPTTPDTRRYAIFFTAQQSKEDKIRDGMMGNYFPDLYAWLRGEGKYASLGPSYGYAVIADFLASYAVPVALDPAGDCVEAPRTSSTAAAIGESLGRAEQEILEAIEAEQIGFAGGWVSSIWLDKLLAAIRAPIHRHKRRAMMRALGYDWHPALPGGRVNSVVKPDDGKPVLYLRMDHPDLKIMNASIITQRYGAAQINAPSMVNVIHMNKHKNYESRFPVSVPDIPGEKT